MEPRSVLKHIREFASSELREKRADRVSVRRAKLKTLMRRGRLPQLRVRGIEEAHYLVCVLRRDSLRVYFLDPGGTSLGACEFTANEREGVWKEIEKRTRAVFNIKH